MNMQENYNIEPTEFTSSCSGNKCPYKIDCLRFKIYDINPHELPSVPYDSKKRDCDYFIHNNQTKLNI